jgi:adenylate cyclase
MNYLLEIAYEPTEVHFASMLNSSHGTVLWSPQFENSVTAADLFAVQMKTAAEVARAIAQPYGIVSQADPREDTSPPDNMEARLECAGLLCRHADPA